MKKERTEQTMKAWNRQKQYSLGKEPFNWQNVAVDT